MEREKKEQKGSEYNIVLDLAHPPPPLPTPPSGILGTRDTGSLIHSGQQTGVLDPFS